MSFKKVASVFAATRPSNAADIRVRRQWNLTTRVFAITYVAKGYHNRFYALCGGLFYSLLLVLVTGSMRADSLSTATCVVVAADTATTAIAVSRGAVEANPLYSNGGNVRWARVAAFNAGTCGLVVMLPKGNGWQRARKAITFAAVGGHGFAVGLNLRSIFKR